MRPSFKDIMNNLKTSDMGKFQLTVAINFIFSEDYNNEEQLMHSKSDNIKVVINDQAYKVIGKHFKSLLNIYHTNLEKSMESSDFVLKYVHLLHY